MKKVVSLLLVLVLVLGMSTVAFAAERPVKKPMVNASAMQSAFDSKYPALNPVPGKEYKLALKPSWFTPGDGVASPGVANDTMTLSEARKSKIELRARVSSGSAVIKEYSLITDSKVATIKLKLVDPFVSNSTDGVDFDITLYLQVDGERFDDYGINIVGTLVNDDISILSDDDYVDISKGLILVGDEYNKGLEVDFGEGLIAFAKIFKGKKYYGVAKTDISEDDDALMSQFKGMDFVYHIYQKGFSSANVSYVTFENFGSTDYVYTTDDVDNAVAIPGDALFATSARLKYLGKGNEELAFASVYYISSKELDVDAISDGDDDDDDGDIEPEDDDIPDAPEVSGGGDHGGDGDSPENINDNPGTGK